MADIGILRKLSKLPYTIILDSVPAYKEFKGSLTENYVLGEIVKSTGESAYYWSSGNTAEVDFVLQCASEIVPIEVKAERNVKARSLAEYMKKYEPKHSVKTSMQNAVGGDDFLRIPLYMISKLKKFIE